MKTFEEYLEEYENQLKKSFTNKETIHWVKTVCAGAISGAVGKFELKFLQSRSIYCISI